MFGYICFFSPDNHWHVYSTGLLIQKCGKFKVRCRQVRSKWASCRRCTTCGSPSVGRSSSYSRADGYCSWWTTHSWTNGDIHMYKRLFIRIYVTVDRSRRNALHRLPTAVSTGTRQIISNFTETEPSISAEQLCLSKGFNTIHIRI